MATPATATAPMSAGTRRGRRALGVVGATLATLPVWFVGEPILGHDLKFDQPGHPTTDLDGFAFMLFAAVSSLLGWALLAVLERVVPARAAQIWTITALVVLVLSFLPSLAITATAGTKAVLIVAHIAVAAVLIPVFRTTTRR
ncbi:DUF6069 family protein [Actinomadura flavalba]|uniref:DUF6069 family protein n=1 Tax=Actinomadura flavalba TaxID=1120938 RepID=UPI0003795387|nr:DUF6069 family protein [Actinomadura flavalba]